MGRGIFLLLLYSIGHSVLVLAAGTSTSFVAKIVSSEKVGLLSTGVKFAMGIGLLLVSFYLFYLGF